MSPLLAFIVYAVLVSLVMRWRVSPRDPQEIYAGGEAFSAPMDALGYSVFAKVALFFAVLHLGVLVLATGGHTRMPVLYLAGLIFILLVLLLRTREGRQ